MLNLKNIAFDTGCSDYIKDRQRASVLQLKCSINPILHGPIIIYSGFSERFFKKDFIAKKEDQERKARSSQIDGENNIERQGAHIIQ